MPLPLYPPILDQRKPTGTHSFSLRDKQEDTVSPHNHCGHLQSSSLETSVVPTGSEPSKGSSPEPTDKATPTEVSAAPYALPTACTITALHHLQTRVTARVCPAPGVSGNCTFYL